MTKKVLLIDGHGLAFRGFYALPETLTATDGTPTNAIVGFSNMLLKCIETMGMDSVAVFFDPKGRTERHKMYEAYKDGRKPAPDSFKIQMPIIIDLCRVMGLPVLIKDGFEADDNIISTARYLSGFDVQVTILTADKDILQTVTDKITVMRPSRGVSSFKIYTPESFVEEFGFQPPLMADYLALMGDSADNIPGVRGIGKKGASELVSTYGTLDKIYAHLDELTKAKKNRLVDGREDAYRSKQLVLPIAVEPNEIETLKTHEPDKEKLIELCTRLGLKKLLYRMLDSNEVTETLVQVEDKNIKKSETKSIESETRLPVSEFDCPSFTGEKHEVSFESLLSKKELSFALLTEPILSPNSRLMFADIDGNYAFMHPDDESHRCSYQKWCKNGVIYLMGLRNLYVNTDIGFPNIKNICDIENAHYLLHPDRTGKNITKTILNMPENESDMVFILPQLWNILFEEMKKFNLENLYYNLDLPLSKVLARLQKNGVHVDLEALRSLENELTERISGIERDITAAAGASINLNSPKQVATLLFEKLHLPPIKKTATGFSTDMSVLTELSKLPEPLCVVPSKLIEYREVTKILSGFVHPFIMLTENGEEIIHSTFDHLSTGTGRLSSRDPNVQNLPVFGEWAEKFRKCLVPAKGNVFVSADYSQVELRVLAHLSGEPRLIYAFKNNHDVHRETASWVFGLPPEHIDTEQRRFAKTVNFGLLYGMSAFGLAKRLGVSRAVASGMVTKYFKALPEVEKYLKISVDEAKAAGYTKSLFGRIRPLSELSTIEGRGNNPIKRVSVNTPIQSAASDIAKIALIKFMDVLTEECPEAKIVLQVHDSIVCECPEEKRDAVEKLLVRTMENVNLLSVPLKVDAKNGVSLNEV